MTPKWNFVALAAIAVILVIFLVMYDTALKQTDRQTATESPVDTTQAAVPTPQQQEAAIPTATGNVDDVSEALILDADRESQDAYSELDADAALFDSDSQELSDLSNVYAGNEF